MEAMALRPYQCPNCTGELRYLINRDAYCCNGCKREFDVLNVEEDHVLYDGGPAKEVQHDRP